MKDVRIVPEMTVLEVVDKYRSTEAVFKAYETEAGECICCNCLFDNIADVADKYGFDLENILEDLTRAASRDRE
jgi:AraC-like DNA-binding protein